MIDWEFVVFATGILLIALAFIGTAYLLLKKAIFNIECQKYQPFQNNKANDATDKPNRTRMLLEELTNSTNNNKNSTQCKECSKSDKQLLVCFAHIKHIIPKKGAVKNRATLNKQ